MRGVLGRGRRGREREGGGNEGRIGKEAEDVLHTQTLPGAFRECNHVFAQIRCVGLQPALGGEDVCVGEDGGVVVH